MNDLGRLDRRGVAIQLQSRLQSIFQSIQLRMLEVLLLIVVLLKSSTYYISNRTISSSIRGVLKRPLMVVDTIVIKICVVVRSIFTKKERIEEFEELYGGIQTYPDQASFRPLKRGPRFTTVPARGNLGKSDFRVRVGAP